MNLGGTIFGKYLGLDETMTPVFLPGESHGQRSLAGYSPWGRKELDMTEWLSNIIMRTKGSWMELVPL